MSDITPEHEMEQRTILREFRRWDRLLETRGEPDEYQFAVNRRQEEESLFTADEVIVKKLAKPLEEWMNTEPQSIKTKEGEEWIIIQVDPKDPYKPRIAIYSEEGVNFYYSELLKIILSSQGRAYELVEWNQLFMPDIHQNQIPYLSYLKRCPEPEEIQTMLDQDPLGIHTVPFQSLRGSSLKRLDYLMLKVSNGETIETPSS